MRRASLLLIAGIVSEAIGVPPGVLNTCWVDRIVDLRRMELGGQRGERVVDCRS
jgi:hypothetical protein